MTVDAAWQPEPGWVPVPGGPASTGVWLADLPQRRVVVKRLTSPEPDDTEALRPRSASYWRREAEVAVSGLLDGAIGLRAAQVLRVEEDDAGITIWSARVADAQSNGLFLAHALGSFATVAVDERPWLARNVLAGRLARFESRGGWPTLARTTVADVADRLWRRRGHHLATLDALPQVLTHGDATPRNLLGRDGDDVVAVDWSTLGTGAVGTDLGYLALSAREDLEALLSAYADRWGRSPEEARAGATVTAGYTALCRAEWALARVAAGPGALAGKYRHPAVAPYLRSLQRLFPQLEALL
jgi:hypothetical protein